MVIVGQRYRAWRGHGIEYWVVLYSSVGGASVSIAEGKKEEVKANKYTTRVYPMRRVLTRMVLFISKLRY